MLTTRPVLKSTIIVQSSTTFVTSVAPYYSFAVGYVRDNITIGSPALNGSTGFLSIHYALDGNIFTSGLGNSVVQVAIDLFDSVSLQDQGTNTAYTSSTSGTFAAPRLFTFTYGQPFRLDLCLGAATGTGIVPAVLSGAGHLTTFLCAPGRQGSVIGVGTGTADFLNSLTLTGLTVTDNLGNPVSGLQFSSQSGTQYGPNGAVPEPASVVLLSSGLGIMIVAFRGKVLSLAKTYEPTDPQLRSPTRALTFKTFILNDRINNGTVPERRNRLAERSATCRMSHIS